MNAESSFFSRCSFFDAASEARAAALVPIYRFPIGAHEENHPGVKEEKDERTIDDQRNKKPS